MSSSPWRRDKGLKRLSPHLPDISGESSIACPSGLCWAPAGYEDDPLMSAASLWKQAHQNCVMGTCVNVRERARCLAPLAASPEPVPTHGKCELQSSHHARHCLEHPAILSSLPSEVSALVFPISRRFASMQNTGSDTYTSICVRKTCSYAQLRLSPCVHMQTDLHACMCLCTYVYMCVCVHSLT